MSTNAATPSTNEILSMVEMQARLASMASSVLERGPLGYASVAFLEKLIKVDDRDSVLVDLIDGLLPDVIETEGWFRWINGGPIPHSVAGPTLHKKPAVSYARQAVRAKDRGTKAGAEAAELEQKAAELMAEAQALRDNEDAQLGAGRSLVLMLLLRQFHERVNGLFAMGPAWRILSIIAGLPDNEQMLQDIDVIGDDPKFKSEMGAAIASVWMRHRNRVAATGKRRPFKSMMFSMPDDVTPEVVEETLGKLKPAGDKAIASGAKSPTKRPVEKPVVHPVAEQPTAASEYDVEFEIVPPEKPTAGPRTYIENGQTVIEEDIIF